GAQRAGGGFSPSSVAFADRLWGGGRAGVVGGRRRRGLRHGAVAVRQDGRSSGRNLRADRRRSGSADGADRALSPFVQGTTKARAWANSSPRLRTPIF